MRHRLFALLGVSLLLAVTPAVGRSVRDAQQDPARLADKPDEWPQVKAGVWEIAGSWTPRQGKVKTWKENTSQCEDPTALFQGYWGDGIVERAGCRFQSERVSATEFIVTARCEIRRVGVAISRSRVVVNDDKNFRMETELREGKVITKSSQIAHWLSECPHRKDAR